MGCVCVCVRVCVFLAQRIGMKISIRSWGGGGEDSKLELKVL